MVGGVVDDSYEAGERARCDQREQVGGREAGGWVFGRRAS
jgi:hypothetical protein